VITRRLLRWTDDRVGGTKFTRKALDKVFPDHWSFMLGEVALYCLMVLIATGVYLTFFFHASGQDVVYTGSYTPLNGQHMSEAYQSVIHLGFDVRAGLLIRQIHHWAALVFLGAIVLHLCRIYFTGAYRRPREMNWFIGLVLLLLAIANGFTGYSLPDDLLSGTGLRIAYSVLLSVPVIGSWMAYLAFGGEFPASDITSRLYVIHVLIVPALIIGLLSVHLAIVWRQKHTQFTGPGRTEHNVVGSRLWPTYAMRSVGLLLVVVAVLVALGGLIQINPIWLYGPYQPSSVSTAAQPDWYMGWLEGALRLFPSFRLHLFGYRVPEVILPAVVFPTVTFAVLFGWPAIDHRWSGEGKDGPDHHLLVRPRDRPRRTALGVAVLTFYVVLFIGGGQDIISQKFHIALDTVTLILRIMLVAAPIFAAAVAWKLCRDLAAEHHHEPTEPTASTDTAAPTQPDVPPGQVPVAAAPEAVGELR
jgi:ubiquinol-cytochrome c reductase cytochrome b subunit